MTRIVDGIITNLDTTKILDEDDAATVPKKGLGAPGLSVIPVYIGQFYVDTQNRKLYFSVGTESNADWELAN